MPRWRAQRTYVYAYCQRCKTRMPLSRLVWQNGVLRCQFNRCVSTAIIGSRDINVARAIAQDLHELEPDKKLTEPVDRKNDQDLVLY